MIISEFGADVTINSADFTLTKS